MYETNKKININHIQPQKKMDNNLNKILRLKDIQVSVKDTVNTSTCSIERMFEISIITSNAVFVEKIPAFVSMQELAKCMQQLIYRIEKAEKPSGIFVKPYKEIEHWCLQHGYIKKDKGFVHPYLNEYTAPSCNKDVLENCEKEVPFYGTYREHHWSAHWVQRYYYDDPECPVNKKEEDTDGHIK
jgi:uncharacterized membrane protein